MAATPPEDDIEAWRQFFNGEGEGGYLMRNMMGGSLTIYPDSPDPLDQRKAAICAELERRGHIRAREVPADAGKGWGRFVVYYGPLSSMWREGEAPQG